MEEKNGSFGDFSGRMSLADLFGPLTTPMSAVDFRDKIKITIKSNAGVKCLKVSKPCDILAISHATDPAGGSKDPKSCDVLKTSLPIPPSGLEGAMLESEAYLKMSPSSLSEGREGNKTEERKSANMKDEGLSCRGGRCSSIHNKLCAAAGGSHSIKTHPKEESLSGKEADNIETDKTQSNYKEEYLQSAKDELSQEMSLDIKEEPLSEEEELSGHMSHHIKKEPLSDVEDNPADKDKSFFIKEEPLSDKEEDPKHIDETQIIPIKIKEEPMSSQEESDSEEESISRQAGGPLTSSRGTQTIWPSALRKDRILPRTLVIRNPQLTDRKMVLPKETLLKRLMELGTPANDNSQEMRTLTCTPVKMYKCSKCGRYFTSRLRLKRHYLAHKKYKVACPECGRLFACKATVLRHQVVHSNQKPFPCSFCEKSFSTDKGREIHQRRHTGDKPFICSECGKNFLFKAQLETHQMIHTGERYSCHECGRCYRTKSGLVLHMRIHRGDVPYFCPECGKGFVQKSNLKNHLHTHSKEKPFTCLECGKAFRQKYNLKQHVSIHAAKERQKYSCSECGKSYKRKADYRWHMLIHLGEKSPNFTKTGESGL